VSSRWQGSDAGSAREDNSENNENVGGDQERAGVRTVMAVMKSDDGVVMLSVCNGRHDFTEI